MSAENLIAEHEDLINRLKSELKREREQTKKVFDMYEKERKRLNDRIMNLENTITILTNKLRRTDGDDPVSFKYGH